MNDRKPASARGDSDAIGALRQEIAALEHELRRVQDGLERSRTPELERRARLLRENIVLCERELEAEISARPGGE